VTFNDITVVVNGTVAKVFGPFQMNTNRDLEVPGSLIIAGGNLADIVVAIEASSSHPAASANLTATLMNVRLWGIP
jgi:hypothetical protein